MKKQLLAFSITASLVAGSLGMANAANTLTVNGNITSGTCTVDVINGGNTANLSASVTTFGTTSLGDISTAATAKATRQIQVSACSPSIASGVTPVVTLTGISVPTHNDWFVSTDKSSGRLAVVVAKDAAYTNLFNNGDPVIQGTASTALANGTNANIYLGLVQASASAPQANDSVEAVLTFDYAEQ